MNDKGRAFPTGIYISKNASLCIALGMAMTGLAYGASDDGADKKCRLQPADERLPIMLELICVPKAGTDGPVSAKVKPAEANGSTDSARAQDEGEEPGQTIARRAPVIEANVIENGSDGSQTDAIEPAASSQPELAVDGAGGDSATVAPSQDTELFNIDIETEPDEEEPPSASERDIFTLGATSQKTSDDFDAHTYSFSYRNHRREWFWPWQESTSHGLDWGLDLKRSKGSVAATDFDAQHLQGTVGRYLTGGTYLQGQLGQHKLETDQGDRTVTSRGLTAMFGLKSSFSLQLESSRDFIYAGGSVTGGITKQLTALDHTASFRWRPHEEFRIQGQWDYRKYDDPNEENTARQADLSALYGISPDWPWVWAGVGAQVLDYDHASPDYWSPDRYTAYGVRFESSFPLYKRMSGSAAVNLNRQNEDGSQGNGYSVKAGLQYRLYEQLYARLDVSKSKSLQQSSTWTSDDVFFSLSGPLF